MDLTDFVRIPRIPQLHGGPMTRRLAMLALLRMVACESDPPAAPTAPAAPVDPPVLVETEVWSGIVTVGSDAVEIEQFGCNNGFRRLWSGYDAGNGYSGHPASGSLSPDTFTYDGIPMTVHVAMLAPGGCGAPLDPDHIWLVFGAERETLPETPYAWTLHAGIATARLHLGREAGWAQWGDGRAHSYWVNVGRNGGDVIGWESGESVTLRLTERKLQ